MRHFSCVCAMPPTLSQQSQHLLLIWSLYGAVKESCLFLWGQIRPRSPTQGHLGPTAKLNLANYSPQRNSNFDDESVVLMDI